MADLIDRQAAIDAIVKHSYAVRYDYNFTSIENGMTVTGIKQALGELPPAQPEIIHCCDCKWYGRADKRRFYRGMDCLQKRIDTIIPDKDFCSRAERREE